MAKIIFKDGTEINAEQNGSCFITYTKPDFPADLSRVIIKAQKETKLKNAQLVECASVDERYWFTFLGEQYFEEPTQEELNAVEIERLKAELIATDYKCLKYVDGALSESEYAEVKAYRAELRQRINELQRTE